MQRFVCMYVGQMEYTFNLSCIILGLGPIYIVSNNQWLYHTYTVVWKKFTVEYFRVKFVRVQIFSSLGVSNE